jgi:glycosyltransferase involved in cell wall biosynthesis
MKQPETTGPSFCVIIPAYNEAAGIADIVARTRFHAPVVVVVDDGSTDDTGHLAEQQGAVVIRHPRNLGKGASLISGFAYAREHGHELVITLDADGQHDPADVPRFVDTYRRTNIPVLIGNRMWNPGSMSLVRRAINRAMTRLLCRLMNGYLPDSQCGFRLYRTDILPFAQTDSQRFAMESEILLQVAWRGFRFDSVRITSHYHGQRSRIHPLVDAARFLLMLLHVHHERQARRAR